MFQTAFLTKFTHHLLELLKGTKLDTLEDLVLGQFPKEFLDALLLCIKLTNLHHQVAVCTESFFENLDGEGI